MITLHCRYWIFCILLLSIIYIIPISSQTDCPRPLSPTKYESITNHDGCGLFCNQDDAATPWTDRVTNKHITILFMAFLIPAFLCNLLLTYNNISEHRENEETFQTTPITYDALFVIDAAYLLVIICLFIPSFSYFDGGNTVASTYICNHDEQTLSINNPIHSSNGLCTLFALFIFSAFKVILIYTGIVCVNIWYRLWKPMVDVGIQKRYIHLVAISIILLFDIIILSVGGIDANPSNGMCYISMNNNALLIIVDIIPNILFIIVSAICIYHATKQLKLELKVIQQADLVTDDLVNLVHRMTGFLIMAVLSSAFIVFTEIIWLIGKNLYEESMLQWIDCTQDKVVTTGVWKYEIGDECIHELEQEGFVFPNEMFFIAFPIAALLSCIAIIILTCHRRQYDRWHRAVLSCKHTYHKISICNFQNKWKNRPQQPDPKSLIESSNTHGSTIALKGANKQGAIPVPAKSPSPLSPDNNQTPAISVNVKHSPHNSDDNVEEIGTMRYNSEAGDTQMTFVGDTPTKTETDLPNFNDNNYNTSNTMIRHPTDSKTELETDPNDIEEYERALSRQRTLENKENNLSLNEQTEMLIQYDKQKSAQKRNKLEHISNVSHDYHNLNKQNQTGVPIMKLLNMNSGDMDDIQHDYEDELNKFEDVNVTARLQSLQLTDSIPSNGSKRDSVRSKTVPANLLKRTSTQNHFITYFEDALQQQSKSTKSVRFIDKSNSNGTITPTSPNDEDHLVAKKAADVILRSATDSIVKKVQDAEDIDRKKKSDRRTLQKSKTSIDATKAFSEEVIRDIENKDVDIDNDESVPDIGDRRLSQQQKEQIKVQQVTERHKQTFLNSKGKRKKATQILKIKIKKLKLKKKNTLLRLYSEFKLSGGTKINAPSSLLKPVTMESQYNIDSELYFGDESRTGTDTFLTADSFDTMILSEDEMSNNTLDVLAHHAQQQTMQWQSQTNIFHFTLTDNEFKQALHTTFTPCSTRSRKMTFDPDDPFGEKGVINENKETDVDTDVTASAGTPLSKMNKVTETQSMNNIQTDRSVTAICSDGKIVLSDIGRFKGMSGHASSVPMKADILSEDEEYDYDIKYDDDEMVKQTKKQRDLKRRESHHRTETLHGRLLDAVPHADRKDLHITIHPDFSCEVAEKKTHYKAETAKLAFTLKPVHSMKILM